MDISQYLSLGWAVAFVIVLIWFFNSIYIIKEWERGAVLRLGRMIPQAKAAGLRLVFWPIETLYRMPLRVVTLDVPPQDIITRDNVSVKVNAVCYFKVVDATTRLDADVVDSRRGSDAAVDARRVVRTRLLSADISSSYLRQQTGHTSARNLRHLQ